jgi:hypothetical protein
MSFITRLSRAAAVAAAALMLTACAERMSRSDFEARVMDRAEHEVRKEIGKPAGVDTAGDAVKWVYVKRTFNIDDGNKFDNRTIVVFSPARDGSLTAREVRFE